MQIKKIVALCLALVMLLGVFTACSKTEQTPSTEDKTPSSSNTPAADNKSDETPSEEPVEVTIWAHCWDPEELGVQNNPLCAKITEETGVLMNVVSGNTGASEKEELATMRASNDLPDIFYVPDMDTMNQLIEAGQILELSEYWDAEKYPNIAGEGGYKTKMNDIYSDLRFNGERWCVALWGLTGAEDQPTVGFYVPWELYKEAGYPEVNSLDDMVDVLETLNGLYSETAEGQKVYGAGGWFADDGTWGSWNVDQTLMAMGYELKPDFSYTYDMTTQNIMDTCAITDPDSMYWQAVEFWYNLNQRGLVDPDSITQKSSQWEEKAFSGRYILNQPGWNTSTLKTNVGMSWVALKPFTDALVLDWSAETDGNMYCISSSCKNPEAALKLLDYLCSPEGTRIAFSGVEGSAWEMVDGKAQFTEQYNADKATLSDAEMDAKYGTQIGHFMGAQLNVISPVDNSAYELSYTPEYRANSFTEAEQDAFDFYGVSSLREIYTKDTKCVRYQHSEYSASMATLPDDLQKNSTDLQNFVLRNYLSCVFASDDADFAAKKQAVIDGAAEYNAEGLFQWYKAEFARVKEIIDPYLG